MGRFPATLPALAAVLLTLPNVAHGTFQLFSYQSRSGMRLCRGNTTTGEAECATGTGETTTVPIGQAPVWHGVRDAPVFWYRFLPPFPDKGAGLYEFFVYYVEERARICVGHTATGEAICADGTGTWGRARGVSPPVYETEGDRQVARYKYFRPVPGQKPGDFAFGSYLAESGIRVCRMRTATGEVHCVDKALLFARQPALYPPAWRMAEGATTWFRFFVPR